MTIDTTFDPAAKQSIPVIAIPTVVATPKITIGWLTSEHLLTVLAILLVTLEGSGVIQIDSTAGKIVAMAVTVLAALGYTAARSYVKVNS